LANIVNAERISLAFGTRTLLDEVSLGLSTGDVVGVVGRNGDGKTTLLRLLVGEADPDSGQIIRNSGASIGYLGQTERFDERASVREAVIGGQADHVWAAQASRRAVVHSLLAGIDLDRGVAELSGGERRRVGLAAVLLGDHDLLVLDEPTNHLDVEAIAWLAEYLNSRQSAGMAMLVVSHDRWFLDAVCNRVWEVHDAVVDSYEGGYAAYVLARAERVRQAAANEARRQNLLRKELAWLRRGPPARTSKPKFRIDAANELIRDVPEARDTIKLREFAVSRLGKDVFDLHQLSYAIEGRTLFDRLDWSIGPGDRIGIIGVNGAGKTTLLRLLAGELSPASGTVKRGRTLRLGQLSQDVLALGGDPADPESLSADDQVLPAVQRLQRQVRLATGVETSTSNLLEEFGFRGDKLVTRIGELSGGERRRLQFLRLLLTEPNVLLLDEPTNDLDIDTLTVIEDYLDTWPGTLMVVSHDRWFLERTCDVVYALLGDGRCVLLPGGVDEYLKRRREIPGAAPATAVPDSGSSSAAQLRQARKDLARIEGQLAKLESHIADLHTRLEASASDYATLVSLGAELAQAEARRTDLEGQWLELAETADLG
jgi:ABC transport system ATP-binding/permease protein